MWTVEETLWSWFPGSKSCSSNFNVMCIQFWIRSFYKLILYFKFPGANPVQFSLGHKGFLNMFVLRSSKRFEKQKSFIRMKNNQYYLNEREKSPCTMATRTLQEKWYLTQNALVSWLGNSTANCVWTSNDVNTFLLPRL